MNEFDTALISGNGFLKYTSIADLMESLSARKSIPKEKGVYVVVSDKPIQKQFLKIGSGGFYHGNDPNVSIMELENNWVEGSQIFYIGKAGGLKKDGTLSKRGLQKRISELIKFGLGSDTTAHWGGRYLWQLAFNKELLVYFRICPDIEQPRDTEKDLIKQYKDHYGKWPFANNQN